MKKWIAALMGLVLAGSMLAACAPAASSAAPQSASPPAESASLPVSASGSDATAPRTDFRIAGLKGPTTMGMVKLISDADEGATRHNYAVEMYGAADEINTRLVQGEIDVAALPANVASVMYNKTGGKIKVAAINTLGVLYVLDTNGEVQSLEDLRGKTIYSTGKGQTPEFVLNYLLRQNGIDPETDINIEYKSEPTEVAAMMNLSSGYPIAVLPQPFATAVQMQNDKVRVALDLTEEWNKVSEDSALVTGVLVARTEFIEQNEQAFNEFLQDYHDSIEWVNANTPEAAELVARYGIVEQAAMAEKALPLCNITFISGLEMNTKLAGYLYVLLEQNPEAIGGKLPDGNFYYGINVNCVTCE